MDILCVVCQRTVSSMPMSEAVQYIEWLEATGAPPVCFRCVDRVVVNLYLQLYRRRKALADAEQNVEGDAF